MSLLFLCLDASLDFLNCHRTAISQPLSRTYQLGPHSSRPESIWDLLELENSLQLHYRCWSFALTIELS